MYPGRKSQFYGDAGPGTFCLALLDTLYQTQRTENKDIDFILVEPNELYHPIARKLITSFSEKISIKSNIEIIKGFFPEKTCLEQVLMEAEPEVIPFS